MVIRACDFHEKLGLRLDASSFAASGRASRASGIDRDFRKGQKHSDHAPLLAELRD